MEINKLEEASAFALGEENLAFAPYFMLYNSSGSRWMRLLMK